MRIRLDRGSGVPLFRQVAEGIEELINKGIIPSEGRLPSERVLCEKLKVDRSTVASAYRILRQKNLVVSRQGSGVRVAGGGSRAALSANSATERLLGHLGSSPPRDGNLPIIADFSRLVPSEEGVESAILKEVICRVLEEEGGELFQYGSPAGYTPLREVIAARLSLPVESVMITTGAQQALALTFSMLADTGRRMGVEQPTYSGAVQLIKYHGVDVVPIPVTGDGWDFSSVEGRPLSSLYLQPFQHNPTGLSMSSKSREQAVSLAMRHGITLIEDSGDVTLSGDRSLTASLPPELGIQTGSFSKYFLPGLRIGWLVGSPAFIRTLLSLKSMTDVHTPILLQAVLHRLIEMPEIESVVERLVQKQEKMRKDAVRCVEKYLPKEVAVLAGKGAASLFLTLPEGISARALVRDLQERGVLVTAGHHFYTSRPCPEALRVAFGSAEPEMLTEGIKIIGETILSHHQTKAVEVTGLPPL